MQAVRVGDLRARTPKAGLETLKVEAGCLLEGQSRLPVLRTFQQHTGDRLRLSKQAPPRGQPMDAGFGPPLNWTWRPTP